MEQADEDIVEKAFVVRSYGKGELASMYICLLYTSDAADE